MEKLERDLTWCRWVLIAFVVVFGLHGTVVNGGYVDYNTGGGVVPGKLNVHLVPHSHDDVGWLKTVDQYYVGSNNSIQGACVENVLDSVVESLRRDSNRKFVFVEMKLDLLWKLIDFTVEYPNVWTNPGLFGSSCCLLAGYLSI